MTIRPRVDAAQINDDIMHALHRSWLFDAKTITVVAEEGRIRLNEQALNADGFLILAHGPAAEIDRAKALLQEGGPTQLDLHTDTSVAKPAAA